MQSEVREISPVEVEVDVQVPWERVQKDLEDSFGRIAKTARIRGFRPGKVPRNVVKKLFGKQVKGEVTAQLVEQGLMEAVQEHELQIVAQPHVEPPQLEEGKPLSFTAKMEVRPKVEQVDLSQLDVYRTPTEVSDEEVDAEVQRLREQNAELRTPEPMRPGQEGDQLTVDYAVFVDGEPREELGATDRFVELGGGRLLPEFDNGLLGAQPGEEKDIEVSFPEDHGREDLRGKTARFHVTVKELREKVLPELDDEFAKDVGDYETLLELRLKIRNDLEEQATRRGESELKEQVVDKLVETNDIPVPPSMIQQQEQQLMQEFASFLSMSGQDMPMSEELHSSMHQRAERRVRAGILLGAVARQEGIDVGKDEVESKLEEIAERTGKHIAKVRVDYQGERREALESQVLEEKLMDFLLARAKIKEGPPPEQQTEEAAAADAPSEQEPEAAGTEKAGPSEAQGGSEQEDK